MTIRDYRDEQQALYGFVTPMEYMHLWNNDAVLGYVSLAAYFAGVEDDVTARIIAELPAAFDVLGVDEAAERGRKWK